MDSTIIALSERLLLSVKKEEETKGLQFTLKELQEVELLEVLTTNREKKTFWINIYNAYIQLIIKQQPELHQRGKAFYTEKVIPIAGNYLSFDDIEHGILRKRKFKYGLGYLPSFFDSDFVKTHQVTEVDFRIHFALNCGAVSCPPIAFYTPDGLEEELEMATISYLSTESIYEEAENKVMVSKLLLWFLGDFGGRNGILQMLQKYQIIPKEQRPKIRFKAYDWSLKLAYYS